MSLQIRLVPCLSDNIGYLAHDPATGATAAIDAPEAAPLLEALKKEGWSLTDILITHHHPDHVQGIPALKAAFPAAKVTGPKGEASKIPALEALVGDGDIVKVGSASAQIIETPGHTAGHIVYYFADDDALFSGDTLFSLGCGRVFETPMGVMYASLMKLAELPEETRVYCGHEYTQSNAKFALSVEPDNAILVERARHVSELRAAGKLTIPSTLQLEMAANPFLRAEIPAVQAGVGMSGADSAIVFAELRERKNKA
jgi:hydroxyacylglutathione hydrolase